MKNFLKYIWLVAFCLNAVAAQDADEGDFFSQEEARDIHSHFVKSGCNRELVKKMMDKYNFGDHVFNREGGVRGSISDLTKSELCVISRSNSIVYKFVRFDDNHGWGYDVLNNKYAVENRFPKKFKLNLIKFRVQEKIALGCGDNVPPGFLIEFRKIKGKIVGRIKVTDEEAVRCNIYDLGFGEAYDRR